MKKRLLPFAAMAAMLASCSSENVLETNPDPTGQALSFSIAVGHTRATETNIGNLGDFKVVAKGVHPHGGVYDNFLIGTTTGTDTDKRIDGEVAKRNGNSTVWELGRKVYWPTSIDNAIFWAYTCSQANGNQTSEVLPDGEFHFEGADALIQNFSPQKADLKNDATTGVWGDGFKQNDLLVAFTQASKSASITLNFEHALSQISITAASKDKLDTDHRIVRIKGAWIVNTKDKSTLKSGFLWDNNTSTASHTPTWESLEFKENKSFTAYGSFYKTPIVLENSNTTQDLLVNGGTLMLIPQAITQWDKKPITETSNNKEQAYILLLCRVELKHSGTTHTGDDSSIDDVGIYNKNHYHQQFPVNSENKFVEGEYGFVCVPVGITFEQGKKYTFNLDICGAASGAGNYPPITDFTELLPAEEYREFTNWDHQVTLTIVDRPDNKEVGNTVLDEEIKFNVSVENWKDGETWTNGSETQTTEE